MTDDEIAKLCREWPNNATQAARAIIAAYQSKLLAGVEMPEPIGFMWQHDETGRVGFADMPQIDKWEEGNPRLHIVAEIFTERSLKQYAAAAAAQARMEALEDAAVEFEGLYSLGGDDIAKCLRQMKGKQE